MSRRIDIELTSARPDGTWTWRAAGAREPKGVVDGALLPSDAKVGAVLKAEAEAELDGMTITSVFVVKAKTTKAGLLELISNDKPFEAVTQQLARRERGERGSRRDGEGRPRRDRGDAREDGRSSRPRRDGDRSRRDRDGVDQDRPRRQRPHFEAPPELPQRPKPKRLKPGRAHRAAVLKELPEAQRAVAERLLQGGIPAVRQAVNEQNTRLRAEGKDEIPAAGLLAIAEQLLPKLRVAEWLDRADAAMADVDELDLRDLRSVVAAAEDPMVARDESTRELAEKLKAALVTKQERELALWLGDIGAALEVGRVVRALKLSSHPPKAGVPFPSDLATRLVAATNDNLTSDAMPDRWVAVLEAVAFSPVRSQVSVSATPQQTNDELRATVARLATLLPQVAAVFGVEAKAGAAPPKPLRPSRPAAKKAAGPSSPAGRVPPPPSAARHDGVPETDSADGSGAEQKSATPAPQEAVGAADDATDAAPADAAPTDEAPTDTLSTDAAPEQEA